MSGTARPTRQQLTCSGNATYRRADRVRRLRHTEEFTVYETVGGISVSGTAQPTKTCRAWFGMRESAGKKPACKIEYSGKKPACKIEYSGAEAGATKRGRSYWRCTKTLALMRGRRIATVYNLIFCFIPTESFRNAMRFPVRDKVSVS